MEEAFRIGGILDKFPTKAAKDSSSFKREDVELIVLLVSIYLFALGLLLVPCRYMNLKFPVFMLKKPSPSMVEMSSKLSRPS